VRQRLVGAPWSAARIRPARLRTSDSARTIDSVRFTHSIDVPASPAVAHAFVCDLRNLPRWDPIVARVEQRRPGLIGAGTQYEVVRRLLGSDTTMAYEIAEFRAPVFARLVGIAPRAVATDTITIEPTPGGSRLSWHADLVLAWPARLLDPLLKMRVGRDVARAMANLERELAAQPQPPIVPAYGA
jgi:hypothetical protein